MRKSKSFKFICLVISFICISTILSIIPTTLKMINNNISGVIVSNMDKNAYGINSDFYMSRAFDDDLMVYLTDISNNSVIDLKNINSKEEKAYLKDRIKESKKALKKIKNADYFIINRDTNEINTNTKYKTVKEFRKNISGECYVNVSSVNNKITYYKKFDKGEFKTVNVDSQIKHYIQVPNFDVYIFIHKNFYDNSRNWDEIFVVRRQFEENIIYIKVISVVLISCIILSIINIVLYKINKAVLFDKESFWLNLSKFIPLELYLLSILMDLIFFVQGFNPDDAFITFIISFLSIGYLLTVIYIFNRQINSYENKMDFFKLSFIYRFFKFIKSLYNNSKGLTKSMELSRRIITVSTISVVIIFIGLFISLLLGDENPILVLFFSLIAIGLFTYYVLKKLSYLAYIMDGTQQIKEGDFNYKLELIGDDNFTTLADNINNIRDGLDKAIESQLKSERMKSELITNVSHDLKTPLTSIINYVELIKKEEDISPEYLKDYISVLDSKSKRLKVLIEDLFEASKASSGNIELNMEKIDITQLLRQSIGELEERLLEAKLDLKVNVPEEKVYVEADGRRLYRVLENLISNISKYSLPDTRVYIDIIESGNSVKLIMKNISYYELNFDPKEIMERFKRGDESRNTEGSGLGLAIARDLVKLQGGKFDIEIDGDLFKTILEFESIK